MSGPLHSSGGYLQPPSALLCRWPSHLSLARFRPPQRTETHGPIPRRVLAPLPTAYPAARLRAHPQLRLSDQPAACPSPTSFLSPSRLVTTTPRPTNPPLPPN